MEDLDCHGAGVSLPMYPALERSSWLGSAAAVSMEQCNLENECAEILAFQKLTAAGLPGLGEGNGGYYHYRPW